MPWTVAVVVVSKAYGGRVNDPAARLEIVRPAVPVDLDAAVLAESWSNDTWLAGGSVLRVCWRGDRKRLLREAALLGSLPAAVPHATVLAAGCTEGLTWMVLWRLPGERLDLVWPRLSGRERRDAVAGMAGALRALHGWKPPPVLREQLRQASLTPPITPDDIVGAGIVPLPSWRLLPLLGWLEEQPGMDSELARRVRARIGDAASASELPLLTWLQAGYPELFDRELLTERVWLYDICFRIRQLCAWGRLDPRSLQDLADLTMHPRVRFP
jgi:hypothetical protein